MKLVGAVIATLITFSGLSQDSTRFTIGTNGSLIYKPLDYLQSIFIGCKIREHNINLGIMLFSNLLVKGQSEAYPDQSKRFTICTNYAYEFEQVGKKLHPFFYLNGTYMRVNNLEKDATLNETYTVGKNKQWFYSTVGIGIVEKLSPNIFLKQSIGLGIGYITFENRYIEGYYYNKTYTVIRQSSTNLIGSFQFTIEFRIP